MSGQAEADLFAELIDAGSRQHYADAALYDYEYRRRRADVNFYRQLASQIAASRGRPLKILELGAGSGRVTIPLLRDGHTVTAVDQSQPMLQALRARLAAAPQVVQARCQVVHGDLRDFAIRKAPPDGARAKKAAAKKAAAKTASAKTTRPAPHETFDLIIAAFNVLEHLYTRVEFAACMRQIMCHMDQATQFAFDVQLPDLAWLLRDSSKRWAKTKFTDPKTGTKMVYSTNHDYDQISQVALIRIYYEPVDGSQGHVVQLSQRKYFPAELEALIAHAGLAVHASYSDFGWQPLEASAMSQTLVCQKARPFTPWPGKLPALPRQRRK